MNALPSCPRKWQVEAANDGRLSGTDSNLAVRHREQCRECADEARALGLLKFRCASLPPLPRDPLVVRRARQELMSAQNHALLRPTRNSRQWAMLAFLPAAAIASALLVGRAKAPTPTPSPVEPAVEIHPRPGARWVVHSEPGLDRAELSDGTASFDVRPHPGRRVLVSLPDGELEDLGTIFEVTVRGAKTEQIRVSQGRVLVRLIGQPEFSLQAGAEWQRATVPVSPASLPSPRVASKVIPEAAHGSRVVHAKVASPPSVASTVAPAPMVDDSDATRAEDAAYLSIVSALHQQRYAEARSRAKAYLLQFPNGFRHVEVLNVATSRDSVDTP